MALSGTVALTGFFFIPSGGAASTLVGLEGGGGGVSFGPFSGGNAGGDA
jgi:hypothetical protein